MAGKAFETYLWARMILNPDLHAVGLFLGSTEANFQGLDRTAGTLQTPSLFLRGMALRCMQKAAIGLSDPAADKSLTRSNASPHEATSSFVICLSALAGWEKIHGDQAAYETHMNVLQAIEHRETITLEGTLDNMKPTGDLNSSDSQASDRRIFDVLHSITSTIHKRGAEIGTFVSADGTFAIEPHLDTMLTTAGPRTKVDHSIYSLRRPEVRTLLFLLTRLSNLSLSSPGAWPAMYELSILIISWRTKREPPRQFARLLTHDELEDLTLCHIRLAMASVLAALTYAIGIARRDEGYFRASDSADLNHEICLQLRTESLLGTQFEEAALWSLALLTATADPGLWQPSTFAILRKLIQSPRRNIRSFEAFEAILRKYAYREVIHRSNCLALWKRVMEDVEPGEDIGLRKLEISFADLVI